MGGSPALHPVSKSTKAARRRRMRHPIFFAEEARLIHARNRIRPIGSRRKFLPALQ
jgi:hypothetical protein